MSKRFWQAALLLACAAAALSGAPALAQEPDAPAGTLLFAKAYDAPPGTLYKLVPLADRWRSLQVPNAGAQLPTLRGDERLRVVASPGDSADPARPARGSLRVELRPYDDPSRVGKADGDVTDTGGYKANRAEVYDRIATRSTPATRWPDPVGSVRWYAFSVFVPSDFRFAASSSWLTLTQWKGLDGGSPPVALEISGTHFVLGGNLRRDIGPVVPGRWTRFEVGMRLDPDAAAGWTEVRRDGLPALPREASATMNRVIRDGSLQVDPNYLKQGVYRSASWTTTSVVHFGPTRIGTTLASVR